MKTFSRSTFDKSRPESREARLVRWHRKIGNLLNYLEGEKYDQALRLTRGISVALQPARERDMAESHYRESERMLRTYA